MAEITIKTKRLVCDGAHTEAFDATRSVRLVIDGKSYKLDLCDEHLRSFNAAIEPWTRQAGTGGRQRTGRRAPTNSDGRAIRLFGRSAGFDVKDKGRLHPDVTSAWEALTERKRSEWRDKVAQ